MKVIQGQCKQHSRKVEPSDHSRIKELAEEMTELCASPLGKYQFAYALAHCQVDHDDPMRFFVDTIGGIYINPKIIGYSLSETQQVEGCYSFPNRDDKKVMRRDVVFVSYTFIDNDGNEAYVSCQRCEGKQAQIFQQARSPPI